MRILALSDQRIPVVNSPTLKEHFKDIDLIVSCGDLRADYLEYVVSVLNVPLVYVPGNHDLDDYHVPGGINVDGRCVRINNTCIAGLGGSIRYKPRGRHQYTQLQMRGRVLHLLGRIMLRPLRWRRGVDLFITHSPMQDVHDGYDAAHVGFLSFHSFIRLTRARVMLHGHMHVIRNLATTHTRIHGCDVVNVFPQRTMEYDPINQQMLFLREAGV